MAKTINVWCDGGGKPVPYPKTKFGERAKRPNRVTCKVCKRRLTPQTVNCEPNGAFEAVFKVPKHHMRVRSK